MGKPVKFSDVVRLSKERCSTPAANGLERYVGLKHIEPRDLKIRRWGNVADGTTFTNVFRPGQVLFGKRRAYQRKVAIAEFTGVCSGDIYVFEPKDDRLLPELLPFICQTEAFFEHAVGTSAGSLSPRTNWKSLADFEFALPPLSEQRQIAEVLQSVESSVNQMEKLKCALVELSVSRFEHYLLGSQGNNPLHPVGELLHEPPRNGLSPKTNSDNAGLKTVSISAVANGHFDPTGHIKYAEIDRGRAATFFVRSGDVFAIRGNGNRNLTGKAGISSQDYEGLFYPDLLIRLRFDETKILPRFALAQWNLPSVHWRLIARAKSSNGIWKVNGQDIRAHTLLVPKLAEQEKILEGLSAICSRSESASQRQVALKEIKASILHRLQGDIHA